MILDTKLVPDFVLHACYFFIAGNRPVLMLYYVVLTRVFQTKIAQLKVNSSLILRVKYFFLITSEISKLGRFVYFIYCQSTKVTILLNFRVSHNQ